MRLEYAPYTLHFKTPGGTSRGILHDKLTCLIKVYDETDPNKFGIGEAALFEGLSRETGGQYEIKLLELVANIALGKSTDLTRYPSIQYGLEQAILDFSNGCKGTYFPSTFTAGEEYIVINGLIWMGKFDEMIERIETKRKEGFHCIKLKIGAIDWKKEIEMIEYVRNHFSEEDLMIRVDANGGFSMDNALPRLARLASLGVHSIEQPIPAGDNELMKFLCQVSPLPIALDESLIGCDTAEEKKELLDIISPSFIILKPALCGGFSGASEWIELANERGIGWWITSALESNVGLNALAQWTAHIGATGPQGLGTGGLFTNNFSTPVRLDNERLSFNPDVKMDYSQFNNLDWRG